MLASVQSYQGTEKIGCISHADRAFEDVLRLRLQAQHSESELQDAYDEIANIYVMREAGRAVLTVRTIHATASPHCEMESLYPASIIRQYRSIVMHTSKLMRHPDVAADHRRLVRLMSYVWANEFAHGMRITFATSPTKYLAGYRALGFAVVKDTSFSFLETGDQSRLIMQPALPDWRSPFTASLTLPEKNGGMASLHKDLLRAVDE